MKFLLCTFFVVLLESIGGFGETPNAFIFSLNNRDGLAPFMSKVKREYKKWAIYRHSDYGPAIGDLVIKPKISKSTASLGWFYSVPSSVTDRFKILNGLDEYSPDKVEVFYLDPSR